MGKYVPPEYEGQMSGNKLLGKNALGNRANKSAQGILTVRFEMPYPIWCTTCPKPTIIGQGVRFNAEKKKVGNYHSTAIFSFRMKHIACGGTIEIRTDPKNTAYVITEGARKRDTGDDKVLDGDVKILTDEEREKLRSDAFASLEGKVEDKRQLDASKLRLQELQEAQDEHWDDPYEMNKRLRRSFRADRHTRERETGVTQALQDKMSLGIELLPSNEEDKLRAGLIQFGSTDASRALVKATSRPLFKNDAQSAKPIKRKSKLKAEDLKMQRTTDFRDEIRSNTRAGLDPFLLSSPKESRKPLLGIKRKFDTKEVESQSSKPSSLLGSSLETKALVDYDSD